MPPTFDFDPNLSPSVAAEVRSLIHDCRQFLPTWCDQVTVRAADLDIEALTAEQPAPLIALPDRDGQQLRLVIRSTWEQSDLPERQASLLRWFILERLLHVSAPVFQALGDLPLAQKGTGGDADPPASDLYLSSLAGLADLLGRRPLRTGAEKERAIRMATASR